MGHNKQQHTKKHAKIWQTEPGLVAFYDIWPGNGAGLFLQSWSQHGVVNTTLRKQVKIPPSGPQMNVTNHADQTYTPRSNSIHFYNKQSQVN